ncbi:MAG: nucleotidyltransferase domain-containing protein, partial [bacterium]
MNAPSAPWHRAIAATIAAHYTLPQIPVIVLGGSAAHGTPDAFSDIDVITYWEGPVDPALLDPPPLAAMGAERFTSRAVADGAWLEQYFIGTLKIDVGHVPFAFAGQILVDVQENLSLDGGAHGFLEGMNTAIVLRGEAAYANWRTRAATYPEALREAMIRAQLPFMPRWVPEQHGLVRGDILHFHELRLSSVKKLVAMVAALNGRYFDSSKWKHVGGLLELCPIAPQGFRTRIDAILSGDPVAGLDDLHRLIDEVLALVATTVPSVDLARAREILNFEVHST